ncbi:MAG: hypothetical protein COV44_09300 [Deltaproteobacteria bacterium CG11_big_fil_rev_8_21_14_0_20_45_16]|nr:MAG: hypothetical protein COV44_09300 [Deltaproteobacteria bacterium CG11_big_fil_rev_8_21_14_0_20_45_16]
MGTLEILFIFMVQTQLGPQKVEVPAHSRLELQSEEDELVFDTIELHEGSELSLPEFKSIHILNLIAKDGARISIANQSSGSDAESGVDGGNGAQVTFFVRHLAGNVVIEARGGDGSDGRDGRSGQQGTDGIKGQDAPHISIPFFGFRLFNFFFGNGQRGQSGATGEDGENGEDGGRGGDGGQVRVYYQSKEEFSDIVVDVSAGQAGVGGRAGMGGLGGNGGIGGRGSSRGPQGFMGANGKNGRPGRPGVPGTPGDVSIYQVDRKLYDCLLKFELVGGDPSDHQSEEWAQCVHS